MGTTSPIIRTYSELIRLPTFIERFRYLKLPGTVGEDTFGSLRYLNQKFYHSTEWRSIRDRIITRDLGCDLGVPGYAIPDQMSIYIHHMNPVSADDLIHAFDMVWDPEYLICTTHKTHNAIHYGDESLLMAMPIERTPYDTCPWRKSKGEMRR